MRETDDGIKEETQYKRMTSGVISLLDSIAKKKTEMSQEDIKAYNNHIRSELRVRAPKCLSRLSEDCRDWEGESTKLYITKYSQFVRDAQKESKKFRDFDFKSLRWLSLDKSKSKELQIN